MEEKLDSGQDLSGVDLQHTEKWQVGAPSALSFESGNSEYTYSPQTQHVQYIPERSVHTSRKSIPATWLEVLTYYRCYATATAKNPFINIQYLQYNKIFWYRLCTVFFKTVPHTYVHIFLASYAPDEHFFLSKMVPITYGFTFVYILSGLFDVIYYIFQSIIILDLILMGITYKNPWNRCDNNNFYFPDGNLTTNCYNIQDFRKKIYESPDLPVNLAFSYISPNGSEYFNTPQPIYYISRRYNLKIPLIEPNINITTKFIYFAVLWFIVTILNHNLIYKRCVWKVLNIAQWAVNAIYIVVFTHLVLHHVVQTLDNSQKTILPAYPEAQFEIMDLDAASDSTTAPPIMHILTTRTNRQHKISGDSTTILVSNTIYFLFKGLLSYRLEKYCGSLAGAPITIMGDSANCFFYLWPMYFSTMFMGELYTLIFFMLHFIMEFSACMITYQCLLEAVVCEWRLAKRAFVTGFFFVFGLIIVYFNKGFGFRMIWYITSRWVSALLEIIGIYWLYPVGRLIDDITFHTGVKPSRLRILSLKLVPFYFGAKCYIAKMHFMQKKTLYMLHAVPATLISLGACYAIYKHIYKEKKGFWSLFRPNNNWGPEYTVRQMRKEFDSREYIGSEAPRLLSRHMFRRAEAKTYTLDIRYDMLRERSTGPNIGFQINDELKKDS